MDSLFGNIMGAGMDPRVADHAKKAKKRLDQGMVPEIMKADGTTGPGPVNPKKARGGPSIWERISRGV